MKTLLYIFLISHLTLISVFAEERAKPDSTFLVGHWQIIHHPDSSSSNSKSGVLIFRNNKIYGGYDGEIAFAGTYEVVPLSKLFDEEGNDASERLVISQNLVASNPSFALWELDGKTLYLQIIHYTKETKFKSVPEKPDRSKSIILQKLIP